MLAMHFHAMMNRALKQITQSILHMIRVILPFRICQLLPRILLTSNALIVGHHTIDVLLYKSFSIWFPVQTDRSQRISKLRRQLRATSLRLLCPIFGTKQM